MLISFCPRPKRHGAESSSPHHGESGWRKKKWRTKEHKMSRRPFNSILCRQPVNLTHCWEINREQKTVRINCWQLTSTTVKPWNPHWFQDVQQPTEEGGGRLCSGGFEQFYLLQSDILSCTHTHSHTVTTYTHHPSLLPGNPYPLH